MGDQRTGEVTELLQRLIRNACVNDGTAESGNEARNADLLADYLEPSGVAFQRYEPLPGRGSLLGRIEGSDPSAPSLMLMGHLDVVPVNPAGWREDPFGGELIDGEVWGRGAIDMLNLTSSMAVAFGHWPRRGSGPGGPSVLRRRRRGSPRDARRQVAHRERDGGRPHRLRADRGRRVPDAAVGDRGTEAPRERGREGHVLDSASAWREPPATRRCRFEPTTRW